LEWLGEKMEKLEEVGLPGQTDVSMLWVEMTHVLR
jgi:hypothetical protein